ncbi:hypothetical protein ACHQM5_023871 [Ranunculus cassubicifolius]
MRHLRSFSPFLNPNRNSTRFLRSEIQLFSLHSSSNLYKTPENTSLLPNQSSWSHTRIARESTKTELTPPESVSQIVDEISGLNLIEVMDLNELLRKRLDAKDMPVMAMMMPGATFSGRSSAKGGGGKVEEEVKEKTAFDLKLDGFDAASKIKIIKEVRTFTDLGLKEAKDLVEKAPTLLKKGVPKEEAEKIIQKMKELGAKVSME